MLLGDPLQNEIEAVNRGATGCEEFIAGIVERYVATHPPDDAGRVHVRMVRLEIDAVKT